MENREQFEIETDLTQVIKSNYRYYAVFYLILIAGMIIIGMHYINNIHTISDNNMRNKSLPILHDSTDKATKKATMMEGIDIKIASVANDTYINRGKEVYATNCASCHGDNGMGDGAAGAGLNPKPRNFHLSEGWVNGNKISGIYKTLEEGIIQNGMAAYEYLPVEDRFALIHLIRSWNDSPAKDSEDDLADLDLTYKISEGKATTNQIPVAKANVILAAESNKVSSDVKLILEMINNSNDEGARLFKKVAIHQQKAINTLLNNSKWKTDLTLMSRLVSSNIFNNGFGGAFSKLSQQEVSILFNFLLSATSNSAIENVISNTEAQLSETSA